MRALPCMMTPLKSNDYRLVIAVVYRYGAIYIKFVGTHKQYDAIDAIRFRMEQSGLSAADLIPAIGRQNRVYEVLNGKRALTLPMIWRLHEMFGIPAESLIKPVKPC